MFCWCPLYANTHAFLARPIPFPIGIGLLYAATVFPVLAPLPPSLAGQLLAFLVFVRNFGKILAITIGASFFNTLNMKLHWIVAVLGSTVLGKKLPAEFLDTLPGGVAGAYSAIPLIAHL
jgi:hypothetical protein